MGRRLTRALLAGVACAVAWPAAAQSDSRALEALNACIPRLDAQIDVGFDRIAARCPRLARTLEASGWAAWLPSGWNEPGNDLSAGSLRELRVLIERELRTRAPERAPDVERLRTILADIGQGERQREGLWTRFRRWVQSIFEADTHTRGGWLDRMIERIGLPQLLVELVTYATLGLVMGLAAFILMNELRTAGVFRRLRGRREPDAAASVPALSAGSSWSEIEQAPLGDKPRLLLELIIDRLTRLRRLPPARSFTVRELTRAAQLPNAEDQGRLTELAHVAERVRYAPDRLSRSSLEMAVARGRELLERLESVES